jgi:hypothetical protein
VCQASSDPRLPEFLRQPFLASGLYDVLPIYPLSAAIAEVAGQQYEAMVRTGTAMQARYDAEHVFHRMYAGATVEDIGNRVQRFNTQYMDFIVTEAGLEAPNHVVQRQSGIPAYIYPWISLMTAAYMQEAALIAGAKTAEGTPRPPISAGSKHGFPIVTMITDLRWR